MGESQSTGGIERRRAPRLMMRLQIEVVKVGPMGLNLPPELAAVYERVEPNSEDVGRRFRAELRDLSQSGAFIVGEPLPLLSRVQFRFTLAGLGEIDTLGWVLWRRLRDCVLPEPAAAAAAPQPLALKAGFGVLFEAIPLEARLAVAHLVAHAVAQGA